MVNPSRLLGFWILLQHSIENNGPPPYLDHPIHTFCFCEAVTTCWPAEHILQDPYILLSTIE